MHDNKPSIFIFCGEPSGDLHGSHLLRELKGLLPAVSFWGVGGPEMRQEGLECLLRMEDFSVMGFSDVVRSFPKLWRQFHRVKQSILHQNPQAVVLIDYPGFNLRLAKHLRKGGYRGKIIQYISPTVWAHGKKRIEGMAATLDLLISIFPFEADCFSHTTLKVRYVGNPLLEYLANYAYAADGLKSDGVPSTDNLIALFPGSRKGEIHRNLPVLLQASESIKKSLPDTLFGISYSDAALKEAIASHIASTSLKLGKDVFLIPRSKTYELMRESRTALAKSGTIALELALHKTPTVVVYKLSFFNWLIAKFWLRLKLPFYCMTNILRKKEVFPEYINKPFTPQILHETLQTLHTEGPIRKECLSECEKSRAC